MDKPDQTLDLFASELPSETDLIREAVLKIKIRIDLLVYDLVKLARSHGKCVAIRFDTASGSSCSLHLISVFLDPGELPPLGFAWTLYSEKDTLNVEA